MGESDRKPPIAGLFRAVETFRVLDPDMTAERILTFLAVAANPGIRMRELQARLAVAPASLMGDVAALSRSASGGGHDLLEAVETDERANRSVGLTPNGRDLAKRIEAALASGD